MTVTRIHSFVEWAELNIKSKVMCLLDYKNCSPSSNLNDCVDCYDNYVRCAVPQYCKEEKK